MLQIIVTKRRLEFEISQLWAKIKNTFARISHTHSISEVSDLSLVLDEIRALIQPAPDKEIINILTAASSAPEDYEEGDKYIDISAHVLYEYDGEGWQECVPSSDCVYIASDTSHIYVWNGSEFVDSTGDPIDNTLYVSNIMSDIAGYTDKGMYSVCVGGRDWYTMVVSQARRTLFGRPPRVIVTYSQILSNESVWMIRYKVNDGGWSEWTEHEYAYTGHKHTLSDIADVAVTADSDAALWVPIEEATITAIVKGYYDPQDTAMFSGHPDYVPMMSAEVSSLVQIAMDAFKESIGSGSGSGSGE